MGRNTKHSIHTHTSQEGELFHTHIVYHNVAFTNTQSFCWYEKRECYIEEKSIRERDSRLSVGEFVGRNLFKNTSVCVYGA